MNVVHMEVCSCPAVVDVTIVRPDLKYQLGFSIHEGMVGHRGDRGLWMSLMLLLFLSLKICSLVRGSIAERSGVRVGHRIIDINGTSTVGMKHSDVVHLLSSTVGDVRAVSCDYHMIVFAHIYVSFFFAASYSNDARHNVQVAHWETTAGILLTGQAYHTNNVL